MQKITPYLWFDKQAEEAANLYVDLFNGRPGRRPHRVECPGRRALRGGGTGRAGHRHDRDVRARGTGVHRAERWTRSSRSPRPLDFVRCDSQEEVDYFWNALTSDGGRGEPVRLAEGPLRPVLADHPRPADGAARRPGPGVRSGAMQAMLQMQKIDIATLERAADAA